VTQQKETKTETNKWTT